MKYLAAIRIRGVMHINQDIKDTLKMLKLNKKNHCVVIKDTPSLKGMLQKCKDYITYGEIDEETYKLLQDKRGEKTKDKEGKETLKPVFRLSPPRGGFERKGIKLPKTVGGVLGLRKNMPDLIKRMI